VSSQTSLPHTAAEKYYGDEDVCINYSSDVSVNSGHDRSGEYNNNNTKPSSTKSILMESFPSLHALPIEGDMFNWAFTPEEHFMINLINALQL